MHFNWSEFPAISTRAKIADIGLNSSLCRKFESIVCDASWCLRQSSFIASEKICYRILISNFRLGRKANLMLVLPNIKFLLQRSRKIFMASLNPPYMHVCMYVVNLNSFSICKDCSVTGESTFKFNTYFPGSYELDRLQIVYLIYHAIR